MQQFSKILALGLFIGLGSVQVQSNTITELVNRKLLRTVDERQVSGFSAVSVSGRHHVYIKMGNSESLRLEGDSDAINEIEAKVENGVLKIRNKKQLNNLSWNNTEKVNIYIEAKSLNGLVLSGSGNLEVKGKLKAENLNNTLSGSGSITVNIDVENYNAVISGSGQITTQGAAKNAKITVAGSGDFDGRNLKTSNTSAKVSGSGNISIISEKELDAVMSGSGDIRYGGNANVNSTKSGSGRISKNF